MENVLYFGVFMLMLNTVFWALSSTASTFWVTAVALVMWCNAQILLDGSCFRFAKLKRFVGLDGKKKCIFSARMFAVYVEASIRSCCFNPARPKFVSLFRAQCGRTFIPKALHILVNQARLQQLIKTHDEKFDYQIASPRCAWKTIRSPASKQ